MATACSNAWWETPFLNLFGQQVRLEKNLVFINFYFNLIEFFPALKNMLPLCWVKKKGGAQSAPGGGSKIFFFPPPPRGGGGGQTEIYTPLDLTENGQNGYIRSHRF